MAEQEKLVCVLCEKPSVGRDVARVLGADKKGEGCLYGGGYVVTWGFGHLASPAMPEEIDPNWKKWSFSTLPMLPEDIPLKVLPSGKKQFSIIRSLFLDPRVVSLICATDAGREGELIFRRIYQLTGCRKPVMRLWISSMTDQAIRQGFRELKPMSDYDGLYKSANCRAEADWLVGMNGSRAFTLRYDALLSVGRVQTPTLSLLVKRKKEIEAFRPEDYYEVRADFGDHEGLYIKDGVSRIAKKEEAEAIAAQVRGKPARVSSVRVEEKRQPPPYLYDLTTLQREANARFGLTAAKTLETAQSLYEKHKLLTYPRTDSRHLPQDQRPVVLRLLQGLPEGLCSLLPQPLREPGGRVFDDSKVSDHHALLPTGRTPPANLTQAESQIYELVTRRLAAAFMDDYRYEQTEVVTECAGYAFMSRGRVVLDEGWQRACPPVRVKSKEDAEDEKALPRLKQGEIRQTRGAKVQRKQTKPPSPYTENTLLDAMEHAGRFVTDERLRQQLKERGLGTPSTRAATLERLIEVGYVVRRKRSLLATDKGEKLIEAVPWQLASPETTGRWEKGLKDIESGTMDPGRFMESIRRYAAYLVDAARTAPPVDFPREERKPRRAPAKAASTATKPRRAPAKGKPKT